MSSWHDHPYRLSDEDTKAAGELSAITSSIDPDGTVDSRVVAIRPELWDRVYEILGRIPDYERGPDGEVDLNRPCKSNIRFRSTEVGMENFMWQYRIVVKA
jgi:hypothetical protein